MKIFEMFAGYGGASFALRKAGIDFETVGYSEIDKYAIQCYEQNHKNINAYDIDIDEDGCPHPKQELIKNYGDATEINEKELPDFDLLTGGFPCQSFSQAGNRAGTCDSRGTLFWDIWRIAKEKKPKYMLLENVKGLTTKTFKETFDKILLDLDAIGYQVDWKVLNSKNYGIPQNRERVWFVCQRKDIAKPFEWPEEKELTIFLKDVLEDEVDEKYYLTEKQVEKIINSSFRTERSRGERGKKVVGTLTAQGANSRKIVQVGMITQSYNKRINNTPKEVNQFLKDNKGHLTISEIALKINLPKTQVEHYFRTDKSRSIPTPLDWYKLKEVLKFNDKFDKIVTETFEKAVTFESTRRVYSENGISPTISSSNADKIVQVNNPKHSNDRVYSPTGISPTLNTMQGGNRQPFIDVEKTIRKITPKEAFRLMGFFNDEINTDGLSNTQKYKLAGNGWTISPASEILKNLLK